MSRADKLRGTWDGRRDSWHHHVETSGAFDQVRAAVLVEAAPAAGMRAVDLGAGTGFLALALAPDIEEILAVDVSPLMVEALEKEAAGRGLPNVRCAVGDLASFDLPPESLDLVVSNYALHHLRDPEKAALAARACTWLRPGGRIVIADMMFGRSGSANDRRILRLKAKALLRKGPSGVLRIAKNLIRFGLRIGVDRPVPPEFWIKALKEAGFTEVRYQPIVAEAGMVTGVTRGTLQTPGGKDVDTPHSP